MCPTVLLADLLSCSNYYSSSRVEEKKVVPVVLAKTVLLIKNQFTKLDSSFSYLPWA